MPRVSAQRVLFPPTLAGTYATSLNSHVQPPHRSGKPLRLLFGLFVVLKSNIINPAFLNSLARLYVISSNIGEPGPIASRTEKSASTDSLFSKRWNSRIAPPLTLWIHVV
jgi:hypothetical protein